MYLFVVSLFRSVRRRFIHSIIFCNLFITLINQSHIFFSSSFQRYYFLAIIIYLIVDHRFHLNELCIFQQQQQQKLVVGKEK